MPQTVLIADDEARIVRLVSEYLEAAGFRTLRAQDGRQALELFRSRGADLVILDIMMPELDGLEAARAILRDGKTPVILLTARTEETDRVVGLELGADDYVSKPFSPRELVARVKAVLRRGARGRAAASGSARGAAGRELIEAGGLRIDTLRRSVEVDGRARELTTAQFDLLTALAREPGRVFSREQLLAAMHERDVEGYERTIDAHIKNLRRALEDDTASPRFIGTVRGVGYRLLAGGTGR